MIALFASIAVAIGTGLAVIAYRHPRGFRKLALLIIGGVAIDLLIYVIWHFGAVEGSRQTLEFASRHNTQLSGFELDEPGLASLLKMSFFVFAYLVVLMALPFMGLTANHKESEKSGDR